MIASTALRRADRALDALLNTLEALIDARIAQSKSEDDDCPGYGKFADALGEYVRAEACAGLVQAVNSL